MLTITYQCSGGLPRGKSLWGVAILTLIWTIWPGEECENLLGQIEYFGGNVSFNLFLLFSPGVS